MHANRAGEAVLGYFESLLNRIEQSRPPLGGQEVGQIQTPSRTGLRGRRRQFGQLFMLENEERGATGAQSVFLSPMPEFAQNRQSESIQLVVSLRAPNSVVIDALGLAAVTDQSLTDLLVPVEAPQGL